MYRRLNSLESSRGEMWKEINGTKEYRGETKQKIENIENDVKDLSEQMKWIRRGMWSAAAFFLTATLMLAGVLVAVTSSGG